MTNRITQQATALVLAVMVTMSVLAGLDVLAASEAGAAQAQMAQVTPGQPG